MKEAESLWHYPFKVQHITTFLHSHLYVQKGVCAHKHTQGIPFSLSFSPQFYPDKHCDCPLSLTTETGICMSPCCVLSMQSVCMDVKGEIYQRQSCIPNQETGLLGNKGSLAETLLKHQRAHSKGGRREGGDVLNFEWTRAKSESRGESQKIFLNVLHPLLSLALFCSHIGGHGPKGGTSDPILQCLLRRR